MYVYTCNTCVGYISVLHVWNICNTGVLHRYHRWMNDMHHTNTMSYMYYICNTHVIYLGTFLSESYILCINVFMDLHYSRIYLFRWTPKFKCAFVLQTPTPPFQNVFVLWTLTIPDCICFPDTLPLFQTVFGLLSIWYSRMYLFCWLPAIVVCISFADPTPFFQPVPIIFSTKWIYIK